MILWVMGLMLALVPSSYAQDMSDYVYTIVGGEDQPIRYPDHVVESVTFADLVFRSHYPDGMEFRATIILPEGVEIDRVNLPYTFTVSGQAGNTASVRSGDAPGEWIATLYDLRGMTPWHELDAQWSVRLEDGTTIQSEPMRAIYYDATREWFRAESENIVVYWFGVSDQLGRYVLEAIASNQEKYHAGFGITLPYRPVAIIFPPGGIWNEYKGGAAVDDTDFGSTGTIIPETGSTIQRVRTLEPAAIRQACIWNPQNPGEEFQFNQAASTTVHEVAHLYQTELGINGPSWWDEGQATFFETFVEYPVHERLRNLAAIRGSFPSFQGDGPGGGPYMAAEDGCTHLIYDMGSSFMLWLVDTHGGIDTYRSIVEEMDRGRVLDDALKNVTGQTLLELENEWRAFLGQPEVPLALIDPGAALADPAEPFFAVGETVTVPAAGFSVLLYSRPDELSTANAACYANMTVTVLQAGNDGLMNWYEVDCMGQKGWISQAALAGVQ